MLRFVCVERINIPIGTISSRKNVKYIFDIDKIVQHNTSYIWCGKKDYKKIREDIKRILYGSISNISETIRKYDGGCYDFAVIISYNLTYRKRKEILKNIADGFILGDNLIKGFSHHHITCSNININENEIRFVCHIDKYNRKK
jgi:hypothetical protein